MASRSGQRRRSGAASSKGRTGRPGRPSSRMRFAAPASRTGPRAPALASWTSQGPLASLSRRVALPVWALLPGGVIWLVMVLLWVTGATKGSFAFFLGTLLCAGMGTAWLAAGSARGKEPLRAARAVVVIVLAAAVPVIFDPHSGDVFNLPKYTVLVIGALVLAGLWAISAVHYRAAPTWRNGLQWVVGAIIAWTLLSALTGVDVHVSLLGNYGSYDGFYSAAAFGVVAMAAAEALEAADARRALQALAFCGGAVVVVYGLVQLPGTESHKAIWDFINWNLGSFPQQVFSTFGNPNHLGGYLATMLPVVVVIGLGAKRWQWRAVAGVFTLLLVAELIRTAARGAWVAGVAGILVLAVFATPDLRRRPVLTIGGAVGALCAVVVGIALVGNRFLAQPLSTLFQTGSATPVGQRLQLWETAGRIALNRPLTGVGPDAFPLVFPQYQTSTWVKDMGADYLVNGAHDIFMNLLANEGFVGLFLFVALLVYVGLRAAGSWQRLRRLERDENAAPGDVERAREHRLLIGVVTASVAAYLVQAVFNVQQVGLSFVFWVALGCLACLATSAGVPDSLRPATILAPAPTGGDFAQPAKTAEPRFSPWFYRADQRRRLDRQWYLAHWPTALVGVVTVAALVLLVLGADMPYRADHDYWAASISLNRSASTSTPTVVGQQYFTEMQRASSLNPREPRYPGAEASIYNNLAEHATTASQAAQDLVEARDLLERSVADEPLWGPDAASEAQVDLELAEVQPTLARSYLGAAASLARQALKDNPREPSYRLLLAKVLTTRVTPPKSQPK